MTARRSRRGLGDHSASLVISSRAKFTKGVEEMIVTTLPGKLPVSHGPGIDHLPIKHGIRERCTRRQLFGFRITGGFGGRHLQRHRLVIDA